MTCKRKNCKYRRAVSKSQNTTCDYMIMTGKSRGCKPEDCDKYEIYIDKKKEEAIYE